MNSFKTVLVLVVVLAVLLEGVVSAETPGEEKREIPDDGEDKKREEIPEFGHHGGHHNYGKREEIPEFGHHGGHHNYGKREEIQEEVSKTFKPPNFGMWGKRIQENSEVASNSRINQIVEKLREVLTDAVSDSDEKILTPELRRNNNNRRKNRRRYGK